MIEPLFFQEGIPHFYNKSEKEYQKDLFDQSDDMVLSQTALHLADEAWGSYPVQLVLDYINKQITHSSLANVAELGCGVGRMIATLAQDHPESSFWGIDYSHQLLKRAKDFWIDGKTLQIDLSSKGLDNRIIVGKTLSNLAFGLAKAEQLPFHEESQDLVVSSFLLDRLEDPQAALHEMYRILKQDAKMILISPLNFLQSKHWKELYPPIGLKSLLENLGFSITDWDENLMLFEPLDVRGNGILWKCLALTGKK